MRSASCSSTTLTRRWPLTQFYQMGLDVYILFYQAQMVGARLGWKLPYRLNPRLKDPLFRVQTLTLAVCAGDDRLALSRLAEVFIRGISDAESARVADAGHVLWLEQPQRVTKLVSQFLQAELHWRRCDSFLLR